MIVVNYGSPGIGNTRQRMGAVVETPAVYSEMTAEYNLRQQFIILGPDNFEKIREMLASAGLDNTGNKKVKNFSLGMKQRPGIAVAMAAARIF